MDKISTHGEPPAVAQPLDRVVNELRRRMAADKDDPLFKVGVMAMTAQSDPYATAAVYRQALINICNVALEAQESKRLLPVAPAAALSPKKCRVCEKPQPCPEHGRTPVTQADYDELSQPVSESLAVIIADMRNEARWRGGHEQHEAYRLTQFANRLSSLSPAPAPLKELEAILWHMQSSGSPTATDYEKLRAWAVSALSPQPPSEARKEE